MKLTIEAVEKKYLDGEGNAVLILDEQAPCCVLKHYLGILDSGNIYCYDSLGRRLDHKWKVDSTSVYNLVKEML